MCTCCCVQLAVYKARARVKKHKFGEFQDESTLPRRCQPKRSRVYVAGALTQRLRGVETEKLAKATKKLDKAEKKLDKVMAACTYHSGCSPS